MSEREYKEFVLADYDQKRAVGMLSSELLLPTRGNIKSEAVKICEQRFNTKDETILKSFFPQKEDMAAYRMAIQNCNADKFKTLANFLENRSINTKIKNINLLAWLIDFNPRPYHPDLKPGISATATVAEPPIDVQPGIPVTPPVVEPPDDLPGEEIINPPQPPDKPPVKSRNRIILYSILLILISVIIYFAVKKAPHPVNTTAGCMIWSDDHYNPVDCNDKSSGISPSPINRLLVQNFKRITKPDTLTLYSVEKVWYAKYNGRVEFFTAGGAYPLDTNRRLLPMTIHILQKFVLHTVN